MTLVKVCGICSLESAMAVQEFGADLIGFVFAQSRRKVSASEAANLSASLSRILKVGVFANQPLAEVLETARFCRLDFIQLHGNESADYCNQLDRPYIRSVNIGDCIYLPDSLEKYKPAWFLLDSSVNGRSGGTGVCFDWQSARQFMMQTRCKFLVSGGITPENVRAAIQALQPVGVDASSGVETDGHKDPEKIRRFIINAKQAKENCDATIHRQ